MEHLCKIKGENDEPIPFTQLEKWTDDKLSEMKIELDKKDIQVL
jgi:hypothetical protein